MFFKFFFEDKLKDFDQIYVLFPHPPGHCDSQLDQEQFFSPLVLLSVWDGSSRPACVFVDSPQQAAAGAISTNFTGGTVQSFHLGQGYRFVPPEQKTTTHHKLDQTQKKMLHAHE